MKYLCLLLTLPICLAPLIGEEVPVHLRTEVDLASLYLSPIQEEGSYFTKEYIDQLEDVLNFDLTHNGKTRVVGNNKENNRQITLNDPSLAFNATFWKRQGVRYLVKGVIHKKNLNLSAFSLVTGTLRKFDPLPLNGDLCSDRRQIHRLVDALYKCWFQKEGIAQSRLLYAKGAYPRSEIWQCDYDGHNAHPVTEDGSYALSPVMIDQKGHDFLYVSYRLGQPKIHKKTFRSKKNEPLIPLRGNQLLPAVSLKRHLIAFISDAKGRADLYVQPFTKEHGLIGKPRQIYSFQGSVQASPTFSPDGNKLVFVSDQTGTPHLYALDLNKALRGKKRLNAERISHKYGENTSPSFSPDGQKIAYSAKVNGVRQICLYDCVTKKETVITGGSENKENPSWSSNSEHLVFNTTTPTFALYLLHTRQKTQAKISLENETVHYPIWRH